MRRNRFRRRKNPLKEDLSLQITSMADIFTILLVFLLKTFSTGLTNISPAQVNLPTAKTSDEVTDNLKLELSASTILIDEKPVTTLNAFKFEPADMESNGTPRSLNAALIHERQRRIASVAPASEQDPSKKEDNQHLIIMADEKTPYSTLRTVLAAAGNSGFTDFKLVVVEDQ